MAQDWLIETTGTSNGFFHVKVLYFNWILSYQWAWLWACELTADGPGLVPSHYRYRQWFFPVNFFFQLYFELSMIFIVSMWVHSSWPRACSEPLGTFPLKGAIPAHVECKIKYPNSALFLPNSQRNQKILWKLGHKAIKFIKLKCPSHSQPSSRLRWISSSNNI
jgi:hypothetical protein